MRPDEVIAGLRPRLSGALVALDFDGTLAPIVEDPADARPAQGALDALIAVAGRGAHIGVVTGRDAQTVVRLGGLAAVPSLIVEGLYGMEQWRAGSLTTVDTPPAMERLRRQLPKLLTAQRADPGAWIEDKRLSLVLHTRPARDPAAECERLRGPAESLAARLGVDVHHGRKVLEFRMPGHDKAGALRRLVQLTAPTAVFYAGDDTGDLPAFAAVHELRRSGTPGWAVAASSAESPRELVGAADVTVDGPEGVVQLLSEVLRV
jgi:trehalose 6-phosphate phosphatase